MLVPIIKYLSIALSGIVGVWGLLHDYKDDDGNLTQAGQVALLLIIGSAGLAALMHTLEINQRQEAARARMERMETLLSEISRTVHSFDQFRASYSLRVPVAAMQESGSVPPDASVSTRLFVYPANVDLKLPRQSRPDPLLAVTFRSSGCSINSECRFSPHEGSYVVGDGDWYQVSARDVEPATLVNLVGASSLIDLAGTNVVITPTVAFASSFASPDSGLVIEDLVLDFGEGRMIDLTRFLTRSNGAYVASLPKSVTEMFKAPSASN